MNNKWRPMMGWMYMAVCMADFVIFPILWSIVQVHGGGEVKAQWVPITLQGAGLFHIAMGAILGIAAYGRTQEKLGGANNGGLSLPAATPAPGFSPAPSFSAPQNQVPLTPPRPSTSFGGNTSQFSGSFGGNSSQFTASPTVSSTGKPMPQQPDHPEI